MYQTFVYSCWFNKLTDDSREYNMRYCKLTWCFCNLQKQRLFSLYNSNELHGPTMSSALKVTKTVITLTSLEKLWLDTVRQLGDNEKSTD